MGRGKKVDETALAVGGQIVRMAQTPFMVASEQVLHIPLSPNDGFTYSMPGGRLGLARPALDMIKDAAGILIKDSRPLERETHVVLWQVAGIRTHIDGFQQEETATYLLDLSLPDTFDPDDLSFEDGGGRYHELLAGYYDDALSEAAKGKRVKWWEMKGPDRARFFRELEDELGDEWRRDALIDAHQRAVREVRRMRPHIVRRAETGAIHALIRNMLGVQHSYTVDQLQAGIRITRAQLNFDALNKLPTEVRDRLMEALAIQTFGIDAGLYRQLSSGLPEPEPEPQLVEPHEDDLELEPERPEDEPKDEPEVKGGQAAEALDETEPAPEPQEDSELTLSIPNGDLPAGVAEAYKVVVATLEGLGDEDVPEGRVQNSVKQILNHHNKKWNHNEFPLTASQIRERVWS